MCETKAAINTKTLYDNLLSSADALKAAESAIAKLLHQWPAPFLPVARALFSQVAETIGGLGTESVRIAETLKLK